MSATASLNGHPRKQLSDLLDRLDGILDVLGEGLSGAVADAVKIGARVAVKEALLEILTNGELMASIQGKLPASVAGTSPPAAITVESVMSPQSVAISGPGLWTRLKAKLAMGKVKALTTMSGIKTYVAGAMTKAGNTVRTGVSRVRQAVFGRVIAVKRAVIVSQILSHFLRNLKRLTVMAVGVVSFVGVFSLLAPQLFATFASGLAAALTVIGMQRGIRMHK